MSQGVSSNQSHRYDPFCAYLAVALLEEGLWDVLEVGDHSSAQLSSTQLHWLTNLTVTKGCLYILLYIFSYNWGESTPPLLLVQAVT